MDYTNKVRGGEREKGIHRMNAGSILIAGVQERRIEPALAAIRGGYVSSLVTDISFAWKLLRRHLKSK